MSTGANTRIVSFVALGVLVLIFGFVFLLLLTPRLISHTDFVFSISRRAFNAVVGSVLVLLMAVVVLLARAMLRRHSD